MITPDELRLVALLAGVPEHELQTIADCAADLDLGAGEWLISEGETASFFGCISGALEVYKGSERNQHRIAEYCAGDTFGELPLLLDTPAVASVKARVRSRVFRLDAGDFRALIMSCPILQSKVVAAMAQRVESLGRSTIDTAPFTVTIVGPRCDLNCHELRDFLVRNRVAFAWRDAAERATPDAGGEPERYPLLELPDGACLARPARREVAAAVGLRTEPSAGRYDLAIVGAGPAGLAAGVYGASEGLRTLLVESDAPGGQAGTSSRIENYLGFPTGLSGDDLARRAHQQVLRFGADVVVARRVVRIVPGAGDDAHAVLLDDSAAPVAARAIVIASGVAWRRLDAPGLRELTGRGVYYGAARTEALAARGKRVHLVGGGNSAGQAALFFADYAAAVTLLVRGAGLSETMSQYLVDELRAKANVAVEAHSEVAAAHGADHLEGLEIADPRSAARRIVATDALFIFIGADAETAWLPAEIIRDENGYVCTGRDVLDLIALDQSARPWARERDPLLLETSVPGIFAAGDVRHGSIKRVAASIGEGSMSVAFVHRHLAR